MRQREVRTMARITAQAVTMDDEAGASVKFAVSLLASFFFCASLSGASLLALLALTR